MFGTQSLDLARIDLAARLWHSGFMFVVGGVAGMKLHLESYSFLWAVPLHCWIVSAEFMEFLALGCCTVTGSR